MPNDLPKELRLEFMSSHFQSNLFSVQVVEWWQTSSKGEIFTIIWIYYLLFDKMDNILRAI